MAFIQNSIFLVGTVFIILQGVRGLIFPVKTMEEEPHYEREEGEVPPRKAILFQQGLAIVLLVYGLFLFYLAVRSFF